MPRDFVLGVIANLDHMVGHAPFSNLYRAAPGLALGLRHPNGGRCCFSISLVARLCFNGFSLTIFGMAAIVMQGIDIRPHETGWRAFGGSWVQGDVVTLDVEQLRRRPLLRLANSHILPGQNLAD
ncbi:MAG: hypothetical protein GWO38_16055 [Phycisphaerae bacterium]|nr:hypothetical protein [Phycisphaerae bacterium]NIX29096.1 hypothetical protein [Phycisphaerae bacterium]